MNYYNNDSYQKNYNLKDLNFNYLIIFLVIVNTIIFIIIFTVSFIKYYSNTLVNYAENFKFPLFIN